MSVSRRIVPLTLDNLSELPTPCSTCLFWELGPVADPSPLPPDEAALAKEAWLSATLLDWGSCGKIAYVAGVPAGYALFAPPGFVPRSVSFPTSPVSGDAVLLMNAHVQREWRRAGIGRMLAQAVAAELVPRGVKAIEAFGSTGAALAGLPDAGRLPALGRVQDRPAAPGLSPAADGAEVDGVLALRRRVRPGADLRHDAGPALTPAGAARGGMAAADQVAPVSR